MGHSNVPTPAELLPFLMLVLQLSLVSAILRAKRLRVGDRCTALHRGVGWRGMGWGGVAWGGVTWRGMGGCGMGLGAAPVSPSFCGSAEVVEEVKASDERGESPAGEAEW